MSEAENWAGEEMRMVEFSKITVLLLKSMLMSHLQMEVLYFWEYQVSVGQRWVGLKGAWVKVG